MKYWKVFDAGKLSNYIIVVIIIFLENKLKTEEIWFLLTTTLGDNFAN